MMVLGVDSSLTHFGWAVARVRVVTLNLSFEDAGCWVTKPGRAETKTADQRERVNFLIEQFDALLKRVQPKLVVIESKALPMGSTSLLTVSALGRVRGLVDALCFAHGVPMHEVSAVALKREAMGRKPAKGERFEKQHITEAMAQRHPELRSFCLTREANAEHVYDAAGAVNAWWLMEGRANVGT